MRAHAVRLVPGDDLRAALTAFARDRGLRAACVASCVGSLTRAAIRFADRPRAEILEGPFEILALSGTLSPDGPHLHIVIADGAGRTLGGHLGAGSIVHTTAEIVVLELESLAFSREPDAATGYGELVIRDASSDRQD